MNDHISKNIWAVKFGVVNGLKEEKKAELEVKWLERREWVWEELGVVSVVERLLN